MLSVLCYGDSNTWGFNPHTKQRFDFDTRWPGVLRFELGPEFHVIEEGLNGRTTVWTDPIAEYRNGKHQLIPCLETHKPLDIVVVMLGTNDLKYKYSATACDIGKGAGTLIDMIQQSRTGRDNGPPQVLLVCPPPVASLSELAEMFEGGAAKSRKLSGHYESIAKEFKCHFLDAGTIAQSSDIDGIHLEAESHRAIGLAVAARIRLMIG